MDQVQSMFFLWFCIHLWAEDKLEAQTNLTIFFTLTCFIKNMTKIARKKTCLPHKVFLLLHRATFIQEYLTSKQKKTGNMKSRGQDCSVILECLLRNNPTVLQKSVLHKRNIAFLIINLSVYQIQCHGGGRAVTASIGQLSLDRSVGQQSITGLS